ncbi:MAG: hypothetical protein ABEJ76_03540 [Halanaeroarchaeum sp.]
MRWSNVHRTATATTIAVGVMASAALAASGSSLGVRAARATARHVLTLQGLVGKTALLAGSGVLLGLGLGAIVGSLGTFLYKRRQIRERLRS